MKHENIATHVQQVMQIAVNHLPVWLAVMSIVLLLFISGCSGVQTAAPVNPEQAISTLETTLAAWKSGGTIEECRKLSPPIVVQDHEWTQGKRLAEYRVVSQTRQDANLFVDVELELINDEGQAVSEKVTYCVGTDPSLTVFRMLF